MSWKCMNARDPIVVRKIFLNIAAEVFCTIKGAVIVSNVDIIRLVWLHVIREDLVSCQPLEPRMKVLKLSAVHTERMGTVDFTAIIIESTVILSGIHKVWRVFRGRSLSGSHVEFRGDLQIKHLSQAEPFMVTNIKVLLVMLFQVTALYFAYKRPHTTHHMFQDRDVTAYYATFLEP